LSEILRFLEDAWGSGKDDEKRKTPPEIKAGS